MRDRHANEAKGAATLEAAEDGSPGRVLTVDDANELREIVVWLLRSGEYRALATADALVTKCLLAMKHAVLVVCDQPAAGRSGWDLLAFCHKRCPHSPVLIISGNAFVRRPDVREWASSAPRHACNAAGFRAKIRRHLATL
jgi:CheY-like chemotaxis protein